MMSTQRLRSRADRSKDEGTSLIELMVVMVVFAVILSVVTTSILSMLHQQRKEAGITNDLNVSRKVIEALDHSARYANGITTPGTGATGGYYVEWQTGYVGQQQTCWQWRYLPSSGQIQSRSWLPPLSGNATPTPTNWIVQASGISLIGTTPIWSLSSSVTANKEQLVVGFNATGGSPKTTAASQVSLTAINSASSAAPTGASAICNQVTRP